jgi:hypothetical protein
MSEKNTKTTVPLTWMFIKDTDYFGEGGLAELWKAIVSPVVGQGFSKEDLQVALEMLSEIAKPQTPVKSFQETAYAKSLNAVVEGFKADVANSNGKTFEQIRQQAENWYDQVEKVLLGLVSRIHNDTSGAFVSGDPQMLMRRTVGLGGMMAITSPSIPVKQNILMTILGAVVSENALKDVYEEYKKANNIKDLPFSRFVEELVQPTNYTWFRKFLDKAEMAIYGKEGVTSYKVSGTEYRVGGTPKQGETVSIVPPSEAPKGETLKAQLKLGENEIIQVETQKMLSSNLLKGILLYVDALATPAFSDNTPMKKWAWNEFSQFYTDTQKAINDAKAKLTPEEGQQLEKLGTAFLQREQVLRYGETPSETSKLLETSPIGERSAFGNALRDFYVTHFGSEATKVKSFGISVLFNTLAEKLGIGSSIMPSVVYDVWMNANIHNLLREAETGHNNTGLPNAERLSALEEKYREALLPYGLDVQIGYTDGTPDITVKDYRTGKVFRREVTKESKIVKATPMTNSDQKIADTIINAPEDSVWGRIRKEWDDRRMFLSSEKTETGAQKAQKLTDLTKVFMRRAGREEWHNVSFGGRQTAGEIVLKELEKAVKHFMTVAYDTASGEVRLLPNNPAYQAIMQLVGKDETPKQQLLDKNGEMPIQKIIDSGNTEVWKKYKDHINTLREGGVPSAFSEQVLKNALYTDKTQPMKLRALQALLWVCTRKAL